MSRVQLEIALGVILVLITGSVLIWYGLNEETRMEEFALAQEASSIEVGAALYEINCSTCHGIKGEGIQGLCPPLNDRDFFDNRMSEVGWSGTLEDYIISTVSTGRLTSTRPDLYPGNIKPAMPAWSEHYGGPLRDDQISNIAAFVMNWESTAGETFEPEGQAGPPVGTDITVELPEGDAASGESLATSQGCTACHIATQTGPAWLASGDQPGIGTRAEQRLTEESYTGNAETPEQYLLESIVHPDVHIVEGFADVMPKNYGEVLTLEQAADLIAYLMSLE